MTRKQFCKKSFKSYMRIDFKHPEMKEATECMLVSVNFDTEILVLRPFPKDNPYESDEFPVHISHCEISKPKLMSIR